jgi:hypothetical protein
MRQLRRVNGSVGAGVALLIVVLALTQAACGCVSFPAFPLPPTALPPWPPGASPSPAITYPAQTATTKGLRAGSEGWSFKPTVDIEVSALGFYDDGRNGLNSPHRAAIFDAAGKKSVVETTIQTLSPLDGAFRWEPVGPLILEAGHAYMVVWDSPTPFDPEVLNPEDASLGIELLYLGYGETAEGAPAWGYPGTGGSHVALAGNFKYRPVPATDPALP